MYVNNATTKGMYVQYYQNQVQGYNNVTRMHIVDRGRTLEGAGFEYPNIECFLPVVWAVTY